MRVETDRFVNPFDQHSAGSLDLPDSVCIERYVKLERRDVTTSERFFYSPFTKAFYRANSDNEEGIYSCIDSIDKSWNSVPVGQSLPGYYSQPC